MYVCSYPCRSSGVLISIKSTLCLDVPKVKPKLNALFLFIEGSCPVKFRVNVCFNLPKNYIIH